MSSVTYTNPAGTITFQFPVITVSQTAAISASKRFTAAVQFVYTIRALIVATSTYQLDTAIEHHKYVLSTSRGILEINYDGFLSPITISPENDLRDGPHPGNIAIEKLHGSKAATITWQIATEQYPTDWIGGDADKWVDFAYTISTTINEQFDASRTISGFLRLNASHTDIQERTADAFREPIANYFPVPTTEKGVWQRMRQEFRLSEDLRTLAFTIVDQQQYVFLPAGCTGGEVSIRTTARMEGRGSYNLSGWLQGASNLPRGLMHGYIYEIMQLFYTLVILTINNQSGGSFILREEESQYTHYWRSNRVEFNMQWIVHGMVPSGLTSDNLEYTANLAANWLAVLSNTFTDTPLNQGPYGSSLAAGITGLEEFGPVFTIDLNEKVPVSFQFPTGNEGPDEGRILPRTGQASSDGSRYVSFSQRYSYKIDWGRVMIPLKSATLDDFIIHTHRPQVYLLVSGEVESLQEDPIIPAPPYPLLSNTDQGGITASGTIYGVLQHMNINNESPRVDGVYRVTWNYILRLTGYTVAFIDQLETRWPYNPMVPNPSAGPWLNGGGNIKYRPHAPLQLTDWNTG